MTRDLLEDISTDIDPIVCEEAPICHEWPTVLWSIAVYEQHYTLQHRYRCEVCRDRRAFPSLHWLNLHLDECHDPHIAVRRDRGEATVRRIDGRCKVSL